MKPISFARHQFPPVVIRHAVWLYLRFTLSFRDVEELLAERGIDASYERGFASSVRRSRATSAVCDRVLPGHGIWTRRNKAAALKLMRRLIKKQGCVPAVIVTDKLRSYAAAFRDLNLTARHNQGLRANNGAEN